MVNTTCRRLQTSMKASGIRHTARWVTCYERNGAKTNLVLRKIETTLQHIALLATIMASFDRTFPLQFHILFHIHNRVNFSYRRLVPVIYHKTHLHFVDSHWDGSIAEPIKNFQTLGQFPNLFVYMWYRNSK
jgi:hypothetical protein